MQQNDAQTHPVAARLLDLVYEAILISDYEALPALSANLERELHGPSDKITEIGLQTIRRKAERNAAVLLAAQKGIRSAQRRLTEIRQTATGLVTYDRSGRRAEVSEGQNLAQRL